MFLLVQSRKKVTLFLEEYSLTFENDRVGLITPDSWKSYPVVLKPRANKKPPPTVVTKSARREKTPDPVVKQPSPVPDKPKLEKPKQIRSLFFSYF